MSDGSLPKLQANILVIGAEKVGKSGEFPLLLDLGRRLSLLLLRGGGIWAQQGSPAPCCQSAMCTQAVGGENRGLSRA